MRAATLGRLAAWVALAIGATQVAPAVAPLDPSLETPTEALAAGCLAGAAGFVVLARRRIPASSLAAVPRGRLLARGVVLTAKSAEEEAIWRALVLGALLRPVGLLGALIASTLLFAGAHVVRQGRRAWAHLVTGSLFGLTYLATGRLSAAVAAHGTYNVLVGASTLSDMSLSDTRRGLMPAVASVLPSAKRR